MRFILAAATTFLLAQISIAAPIQNDIRNTDIDIRGLGAVASKLFKAGQMISTPYLHAISNSSSGEVIDAINTAVNIGKDAWEAIQDVKEQQAVAEADFTKGAVKQLRAKFPNWNVIVYSGKR